MLKDDKAGIVLALQSSSSGTNPGISVLLSGHNNFLQS